ncbi:hypothetical protein ENUP19_0046G0058 [Entamoeba nuttalli]|uniref:t-SNARE coiled-coil homology domain-containing protein n=1 Tax=Entamoeba nuttalli TaxID=412467 RepID=A0ABQ0DAM8_9EUKA
MTFDRTSEFKKYIRMKGAEETQEPLSIPQNKQEMLNDIKVFNKNTTELFKNINKISGKLAKLTELAKSKSLFEEQQTAPQIQRLTNEIHTNLQEINKEMKQIEENRKEIEKKYGITGQNENHREIVCKHLNYLVKNTTKSFTDVLQIRAESIKEQEKKKHKYSTQQSSTSNQIYQRNLNQFSFNEDDSIPPDSTEVDIPQSTSVLLTNEHLEQRVQGVQNIEHMLNELLGLYNHITFLVSTQEEMVRRIDENTEEAVFNVEQGHSQLQEALHSISSNRGLIIKSLLIILFFALVFLVFFL